MASNDVKATIAAAEAAKAKNFERTMKIMKKAVLEVQLILLDGVSTDEQLQAAGKILSQSEYNDVVEERCIAKVCGYARCSNPLLTENMRKGRYRISLSAKKVYDLEESRHFCSPSCLIASKDFGNKLSSRQDLVESVKVLEEILCAVRGLQYSARSKPTRLKEDNVLKPSARSRNVKRGKLRPKETSKATPASSNPIDSTVVGCEKSETIISTSKPSGVPADSILISNDSVDVSCMSSGSNVKDIPIVSELNQNSCPAPDLSPFHNVLIMPSAPNSNCEDEEETAKKSKSVPRKHPGKVSLPSSVISSKVETKFEKLSIQERVGDQPILPIFDYGGPSDAIEGYVPLRSRNRAVSPAEPKTKSKSKVSRDGNSGDNDLYPDSAFGNLSGATFKREREEQRKRSSVERNSSGKDPNLTVGDEELSSERPFGGQRNESKVFKEWEGLVSGSSEMDLAKMCITEMDSGISFADSAAGCSAAASAASTSDNTRNNGVQLKSGNLKPALKNQATMKRNIRNVVWADQENTASYTEKTESKERSPSSKVDKVLITEDGPEDVKGLKDKVKSMQLKEKDLQQTNLLESNLDSVMAARLASAEAIANALTEAATSAATGEVDGSEAVTLAGLSILSATHNANPTRGGNSQEAQDRSEEILDSMKNYTIDEDELYAKAVQAREEVRRLKMPRKHEIASVDDLDNEDLVGDLDLDVSNFDDDDDDADEDIDDIDDIDDDDDDDDDETSGGFEGASEVGFRAPPKGFKAEVSMFGTTFMALESWISGAALAHIYGKEPQEEDQYLSVNGKEYSRQVFIGDGVSSEILRTFSLCVSRALPEVVRALRLPIPISTLEVALGKLIKNMSFVEALPPFSTKQWRMLVIVMLDALSVQRLPRLGVHLMNNRSVLRKILDSTGTNEAEYDVFRDVFLPLGRSPTFSTLSGG